MEAYRDCEIFNNLDEMRDCENNNKLFSEKNFENPLTSALPSAIIQLSEGKKQTTRKRGKQK